MMEMPNICVDRFTPAVATVWKHPLTCTYLTFSLPGLIQPQIFIEFQFRIYMNQCIPFNGMGEETEIDRQKKNVCHTGTMSGGVVGGKLETSMLENVHW